MKYISKITIRGSLGIDTDAKNAISKFFVCLFVCLSVCLSVCITVIETKNTGRILTKLGTIFFRTPRLVIVYFLSRYNQ